MTLDDATTRGMTRTLTDLAARPGTLWVVFAGKDAVKAGINAGKLATELASIVGGGGGGKDYFGQGGGREKEKLQKLTRLAPKIVSKQLKKK